MTRAVEQLIGYLEAWRVDLHCCLQETSLFSLYRTWRHLKDLVEVYLMVEQPRERSPATAAITLHQQITK